MTLTIREARPEEYGEVAAVILAANEEHAAAFGDAWAGYRDDLSDIAEKAGRGRVLVAEAGGRLIGTITYYPPDPDAVRAGWWWWPGDYAALRVLAVHPSARRTGAGRALATAAIDRARAEGAAGVALNTTQLQPAAQALYEGLGFRRIDNPLEWGAQEVLSYVLTL